MYFVLYVGRLRGTDSDIQHYRLHSNYSHSLGKAKPIILEASGLLACRRSRFPQPRKANQRLPNNSPTKCQDACYKAENATYRFAGMAAGCQCWCGDFVRNDMSANETTDCNIPCAGETAKTCGGARFLDIYEPDFSAPQPTSSIPVPPSCPRARSRGPARQVLRRK